MHTSEAALLLMKLFRAAVRKHFRSANMYWIGSEARTLWASGWRLTIAVQSPPEYNMDYSQFAGKFGD
jgi:hypothetical protein